MNPQEHIELLAAAGIRHPGEVIAALGGIDQVALASVAELHRAGVPIKTAEKLVASFKIGRFGWTRAADRAAVCHPHHIFEIMRPTLGHLAHEEFWVIAIDVRNGMIGHPTKVGQGTATAVEVHPREVFRSAIKLSAAGVIVCHNHPSGDPTPSIDDIELTKRLRSAGELLGIPMIDHVVICGSGYRSIAEQMGTGF